MPRTFITLGLPQYRPFRLWLADHIDELAAIHPETGEALRGQDMADMAVELSGLLRFGGQQLSTDAEEILFLSGYLQDLGERFQETDQGAFAEAAIYMGLWLPSIIAPDD